MAIKRKIDEAAGQSAIRAYLDGARDRQTIATAVRFLLEELATLAPGKAVEVRVPPYGAVQCIPGLTHTRGTPPNVIETDPATWLSLALAETTWEAAVESGAVTASGSRATIAQLLPLWRKA